MFSCIFLVLIIFFDRILTKITNYDFTFLLLMFTNTTSVNISASHSVSESVDAAFSTVLQVTLTLPTPLTKLSWMPESDLAMNLFTFLKAVKGELTPLGDIVAYQTQHNFVCQFTLRQYYGNNSRHLLIVWFNNILKLTKTSTTNYSKHLIMHQ